MGIEIMTISEMAEKTSNDVLNELLKSDEFKALNADKAADTKELAIIIADCARSSFSTGASWVLLAVDKFIYENDDDSKSFVDLFHEAIERVTVGSKEIRNENVKRKRK